MIVAAALAGVIVLIAAGLTLAARLVHIGKLQVGWPAHPRQTAALLVALDHGDERSVPLLAQWCTRQASVAPVRQQGPELEFRRRQSLERVHAILVAEQLMATPHG